MDIRLRLELICRYFGDPVCAAQSMAKARCRGRKAGHCIFGAGVNSAPAATTISYRAEKSSQMAIEVGDPATERARFARMSPLDHVEEVGVRVLLGHGLSDRRVPSVHE